ncbi:MAG: recombinase family protein [Proteobacteria bacterium]|nr:recombinase family protein [Pseudomonadota bacterium]
MPVVRIYLRRSKADKKHQEFSLEVQREGSQKFVVSELPGKGIHAAWEEPVEYVDDDRAGDDFMGRPGLLKLRAEVRPGDIVVCRDQSRLGRDALETTLVVRELVRDRQARLFYYISGGDSVAHAGGATRSRSCGPRRRRSLLWLQTRP